MSYTLYFILCFVGGIICSYIDDTRLKWFSLFMIWLLLTVLYNASQI